MIKIIAFSWFFTHFEPLQYFIDRLATFFVFKTSGTKRHIVDLIHSALGCMKCISFWISLVVTGDFFTACLTSLIAYTIQLCLQKLK